MAVTVLLRDVAVQLRLVSGTTVLNPDIEKALTTIVAAATAVIEKVYSKAPEAVQNEAVVLITGWLYDQPNSGLIVSGNDALRLSGAAALLSHWKVRRLSQDSVPPVVTPIVPITP